MRRRQEVAPQTGLDNWKHCAAPVGAFVLKIVQERHDALSACESGGAAGIKEDAGASRAGMEQF